MSPCPLGPWQPHSIAVPMDATALETSSEWNPVVFVLLRLAHPAPRALLQVQSPNGKCQRVYPL